MPLSKKEIKRIMKEYKDVFKSLEQYDKTHEISIGRARIDITLDKKIIKKLERLKEKQHKPISRIIEEAIARI